MLKIRRAVGFHIKPFAEMKLSALNYQYAVAEDCRGQVRGSALTSNMPHQLCKVSENLDTEYSKSANPEYFCNRHLEYAVQHEP
jgi:hypothetical protein